MGTHNILWTSKKNINFLVKKKEHVIWIYAISHHAEFLPTLHTYTGSTFKTFKPCSFYSKITWYKMNGWVAHMHIAMCIVYYSD